MSSNSRTILAPNTLKIWQKEKYEEIALQTSGHAAEFLQPDGKGVFYKYKLPKFQQITRGLKAALFDGVLTRSSSNTNAGTSDTTGQAQAIDPSNFAPDMFDPVETLEIVSDQLFLTIQKAQSKLFQDINSKNLALTDHKPVIWNILEKGVPTSYMNLIRAKPDFSSYYQRSDVEWFFKTITEVVLTEQSGIQDEDFEIAVMRLNCKQGDNESLANYFKRFDQNYKVFVEVCKKADEQPSKPGKYAAKFVCGLNSKHNEFVTDVRNWAKAKIKPYPKNYTDAYQLCSEYKPVAKNNNNNNNHNSINSTSNANAFATTTTTKPTSQPSVPHKQPQKAEPKKIQNARKASEKKDGVLKWKNSGEPVKCTKCSGNHLTFDCTKSKDKTAVDNKAEQKKILQELLEEKNASNDDAFMIFENVFANSNVDFHSVLLDCESSQSIFSNAKLIIPGTVTKLDQPVQIRGAGGVITAHYQGESKLFGKVLYCPLIPCQILCFYNVSQLYKIDYLQSSQTFRVHISNASFIDFTATSNNRMYIYQFDQQFITKLDSRPVDPLIQNVYYQSLIQQEAEVTAAAFSDSTYVNTVAQNIRNHTKQEVQSAYEATEFQRKLAYASDADVHKAISCGTVTNLSVTNTDLKLARDIYGKPVSIIKGKTRWSPPPVYRDNLVPVLERKRQEFHSDLFFVSGLPFLLSVALPMDHVLVNSLPSRSATVLFQNIKEQVSTLTVRGFTVTDIYFDAEGAIAKCQQPLREMGLIVHASTGKVPHAERKVQTLKGRIRSVTMSLQYALCRALLVLCVLFCASRLNMVASSARPNNICTMESITGRKVDMNRDLRYGFGDYVEVPVRHTDNDVTHPRTETAIAVMSTGNTNGDWKFFKPFTGTYITRPCTKPALPATEGLIQKLNELAGKDGNLRSVPHFTIGRPDGIEVILPPEFIYENELPNFPSDESFVPTHMPVSSISSDNSTPEIPPNVELRGDSNDETNDDHSVQLIDPIQPPPTIEPTIEAATESTVPENTDNLPQTFANGRYPARKSRTSWKDHSFIANHYTRRQAETKFGKVAIKAKKKEILQLNDMEFAYPVDFSKLNREQRRKIIRSHIIYQPKYDPDTGAFIKLKARFVGNGSTQMQTYDVSSPTVTTHAVFINAAIAAKERRKVKTADLPGAYLNADMSGEEVLMHINPDEADILCLMKPEYKEFLREDGSLIVRLTKALYGCIQSAKLWYNEISTTLKSIGYAPNPKDICVFNKVVDGVQCTITLHVDDLMVTSINEQLIDEVMQTLKQKYERPDAKIEVKEGKVHKYLGMTLDFSNDGKVIITMNKYIRELLKFTNTKGHCSTPATEQLYVVVDAEPLDSERAEYFHSIVAKLLYLAKRVRPDLLTSVGFLAKRTRAPNEYDMKKLERILRYLNGTQELGITLCPGKDLSVIAYIDASYAVHNDMKSQTGVATTLGTGVTYAKSTTQQLNAKSSTESELIALTDGAGHVIWFRDYLIGQGYDIGPATIYQDNMSTMALVQKGYSSASNTRHINIFDIFSLKTESTKPS